MCCDAYGDIASTTTWMFNNRQTNRLKSLISCAYLHNGSWLLQTARTYYRTHVLILNTVENYNVEHDLQMISRALCCFDVATER